MYPQSVGDLVSTLSQRFTTLFHYRSSSKRGRLSFSFFFSWGKASRGPGLHLKSRYINDVGQDKVPFYTTILTRSLLWREASTVRPTTNTFIFKWMMKNESLVVLHRRRIKRNTIILLWWFETPHRTYFYFTAKSCLVKVRRTFCASFYDWKKGIKHDWI